MRHDLEIDVTPEGYEANNTFELSYEDIEAEIRSAGVERRLETTGTDLADLTPEEVLVSFQLGAKHLLSAEDYEQLMTISAAIVGFVYGERSLKQEDEFGFSTKAPR